MSDDSQSGSPGGRYVRAAEDAAFRTHFQSLSPADRVREYFYDSNTGLPNERGWEVMNASKIGPQQLHVHYSIEGVAWVNDTFGHDAGQVLYRAAAEALSQVDRRCAKVGGDFGGRAEDEEDAQRFARMATRKLAAEFQGLTITAAVGETWEEAKEAHKKLKVEMEALRVRAKRGTRPLGLDPGWTPVEPANWGRATAERPVPGRVAQATHHELEIAYTVLEQRQVLEHGYRDPLTGLLGHTGMHVAAQRGDRVLSMDLDGLHATDVFKHELGDEVLRRVGLVMASLQEEMDVAFNAAHPHGDEFAAAHPNAAWLRKYAEDVKRELATETVSYTDLETGRTYEQRGIGMSYGVGATRDLADAELKRDKADRVLSGERDPKGQADIANSRLSVRPATPEELSRARAFELERDAARGRSNGRVERVRLGVDGPMVSRLKRVRVREREKGRGWEQ